MANPDGTREIYFGITTNDEIIVSNIPKDRENECRFRHNMVWLNDRQPLSSDDLPSNLRHRLLPQTVVNVSDFITDILQSLLNALKVK